MARTLQIFEIPAWLEEAFRGDVPSELRTMAVQTEVRDTVFREMLTQVPRDVREALEHLYEMQRAERALLYGALEELFKRHLQNHPT
ncbi:MAG: hypothetical protein HY319_32595 [Armatimonadetes bacterium]|nr:hypothetical protein [Armatimonadota bacterium]